MTIIDKLNKIKEQKTLLKTELQNCNSISDNCFDSYAQAFNNFHSEIFNKLNDILDITTEYPPILTKIKNIYCIGDSLTQGAGGDGYKYTDELNKLLQENPNNNLSIINRGLGGINCLFTGFLNGAIYPTVKSIMLSGGENIIEFEKYHDEDVNIMSFHSGIISSDTSLNTKTWKINDCTIGNCIGTFFKKNIDSKNVYTFTPSSLTTSYEIPEGSKLIPAVGREELDNDDMFIIWAGTNDSGKSDDYICNVIQDIITAQTNGGKYIVLGLTYERNNDLNKLKNTNNVLKTKFKDHFIDLHTLFVADTEKFITSNNEILSDEDIQLLKDGRLPKIYFNESNKSNKLHFNKLGYTFIGQAVYNHGKNILKYWR